jgi:hypothetical protein
MAALSEAVLPNLGTDAELIERSLREPERFAELFDRYYSDIHGFAARRVELAGRPVLSLGLDTASWLHE